MRRLDYGLITAGLLCVVSQPAAASTPLQISTGWRIESSAKVTATGDAISQPGFDAKAWHAATVPTTVVAALVANKELPDPYFGMNLGSSPRTSYPVGGQFANLPMPADSPYNRPWWYRAEFTMASIPRSGAAWLHFDGINFRANVWLNGRLLASKDSVAGAYCRYVFDVSKVARTGTNAVAVEVFPPSVGDLAINWV